MSEAKGYPAHQPFCIKGRKNLTKKAAWWQVGNSNNRSVSKKSKTQGESQNV